MKNISIFNDVLGPVMRGPSSSHTAGSYHLGAMARSLLDDVPVEAEIVFDPAGSYVFCYQTQASDLGFAAGLLGWAITDDRFPKALELAAAAGLHIHFRTEPITESQHPNAVRIMLQGKNGKTLNAVGQSIGGGAVEIVEVAGWPVHLNGMCFETFVETDLNSEASVRDALETDADTLAPIKRISSNEQVMLLAQRRSPLPQYIRDRLFSLSDKVKLFPGSPLGFVKQGSQIFVNAADMISLAESGNLSLGRLAVRYEAALLGLSENEVIARMAERADIMVESVRKGLRGDMAGMQLLRPTAGLVFQREAEGRLAIGGLHTRAAARAMAAMHVNCGKGVVCAAPTAGSAGVIPGVLTTLMDEKGISRESLALALMAAGAIGVIVAERATFAAEVAGCQVEIGAAGAMAAAAVVEVAGGSARQACDAAAISFQNTMGSVCDLVQGIVEIPCHTRNAAAASAAFVNADLVLGGYQNPIPLDETIDAVYAVGLAMPTELRVTSLGGLAVAPSAVALPRLAGCCKCTRAH